MMLAMSLVVHSRNAATLSWIRIPSYILTRLRAPTASNIAEAFVLRSNLGSKSRKVRPFTATTTSGNVYEKSSENFIARYNGPKEDELTDEQKTIRDEIISTRKRTGLAGPFGPWLAVPAIADPAQKLGRACRYETSLSFKESELIILLTGAKTRSHSEFDIHVGEALKAGWTMDFVNAIPRDDDWSVDAVQKGVLPLLETDRQRAIAMFTAELLETSTVSVKTYEATKTAVGEKDSVLVEITSITGYYTFVSYTLNVFRIPSK